MRPNFKVDSAKFYTCGSREQYIKPTEKMPNANFFLFQCNPNSTYDRLFFLFLDKQDRLVIAQ